MTHRRLPLSSLFVLSLASAALLAPGCGNAEDGGTEPVDSIGQRATAGLVITEIAYDPPTGAEDQVEWIEVYNPGDTEFDFTGGVLRELSGGNPVDHNIVPVAPATKLIIPAKGYLILGSSQAAVHEAGSAKTLVNGTYGVAGLNNTGDTITILNQDKSLTYDTVTYKNSSPWPSHSGAAFDGTTVQLSADKLDTDNNVGGSWCHTLPPASYALLADGSGKGVGTPGAPNQTCVGSGAGGGGGAAAGAGGAGGAVLGGAGGIGGSIVGGAGGATAGAGGATAGAGGATAGAGGATAGAGGATAGAGGATAGAGGGSTGPGAPLPGDVVINEIMANPAAVDDAQGEWFELRNLSDKELELKGIVLTSGATNHTVASSFLVGPKGYAVFALNADSSLNGGLPANVYKYPSGFQLGNTSDTIIIKLPDGTLLDSVSYGTGEADSGISRSLSDAFATPDLNGTDTDAASAAWCQGTTTYGAGDVGTPGAANDPCGGGTAGAGGNATGGSGGAATAGAGGTAGKSGAAGKAGAAGAAGKAGAAGAAGKAGAAGSTSGGSGGAATAGAGGEAGSSAGTGGSGTAGKGGAAGKAGAGTAGAATGGSAGSSTSKGGAAGKDGTTSKGGSAGSAGSAAALPPEESADSGCGCRTAPSSVPGGAPASLGLAALGLLLVARRKRSLSVERQPEEATARRVVASSSFRVPSGLRPSTQRRDKLPRSNGHTAA